MVSKQTLAVLAVLATVLAVAAGTALAVDGSGAASAHNRTISVAGTGEIDAAPDAAEVHLAVRATGPDAASVSSSIAADAEALRSALADFGIPAENVQTASYYVREDPRTRDQPNETRYAGRHTFQVTVDDVERVGGLIDAATDAGADDVGGVSYTLSEDRREQLRDEALQTAVTDARGEAAVLANATDLEVTGVVVASTQGTDVRPYRTEFQAAADAGTTIEPRDVTVSATVDVTFAARPA